MPQTVGKILDVYSVTSTRTIIIFLPGFGLCAFAARRGVRGQLKCGLIILPGIAVPGYLLFWIYLFAPQAGCNALPFVYGAFLLIQIWKATAIERATIRSLLVPVVLVYFGATGLLAMGYEYGGLATPEGIERSRFSHDLPIDDELPFFFAEGLMKGSVPKPLAGDWLSSDRPSLQTSMILTLEPFMKNEIQGRHLLWYHVAAVVLQTLWIFPVYLCMRAFNISNLTSGLVLLTVYVSGTTIVNGFYVWPKLLAATYMLAFAIPILASRYQLRRGSWLLRWLMGSLLALGLLSQRGKSFCNVGAFSRRPHSISTSNSARDKPDP